MWDLCFYFLEWSRSLWILARFLNGDGVYRSNTDGLNIRTDDPPPILTQ